jgi:hypothetical protein
VMRRLRKEPGSVICLPTWLVVGGPVRLQPEEVMLELEGCVPATHCPANASRV